MIRLRTAFVAAALALIAVPAIAGQCPLDIKKIDAALAAGTSLDAAKIAEVKAIRDQGAKLHKGGKHGQSVATLATAKAILGIE